MNPMPTLFQNTRAAATVDLTLMAVAAAAGFLVLLTVAAFDRLHLLG